MRNPVISAISATSDAADTTYPDAVLWDMDGTLVDTEPYWMEAENALVAEHGGSWTHEQALQLVGNPLIVSAEVLQSQAGVDLPAEEIVDRLLAQVVARVREHVPWQPGARELLAELAGLGVPNALVTMSWTSLARVVVEALPAGTFAAVVTGDQVAQGKPHPEPYLTAADRLGVDPRRCVAIEDSVTGLRSAEAAGAASLGVPHMVPLPDAPGRTVLASLQGVDAARLGRLLGPATAPAGQDLAES